MSQQLNIKNKRAFFDFEIMDTYTAGLMLTGTEIKSIRNGKAHINEAFCQIKKGELFIINMYVDVYEFGSYLNHEPRRARKLLLNKREVKQIVKKITEKGLTVIPIKIFLSERGLAKIEVAVAKGKKTHDKRQSIKSKDIKRETDRVVRNYKK
jgi:SsrA-binding protein